MEEELNVTRFTRCPLSLAMHEVNKSAYACTMEGLDDDVEP